MPYPVVLCDELHRWAGEDLFQTLSVALSKRAARMLVISTSGEKETPTPLWGLRERALAMNAHREGVQLSADSPDRSFALRELSAPEDADWRDLDIAQQVNPLVSRQTLAQRLESPAQTERSWRRFTLNQWTAPAAGEPVISLDSWDGLLDSSTGQPDGVVCFAVDVSLERDIASIAAARWMGDRVLVQVVDSGLGTAWAPERLVKLTEAHRAMPVVLDGIGPSGALQSAIEEWDTPVRVTTTREFAQSFAVFVDLVAEGRIVHRGDPPLRHAIEGAVTRPLSDSRAWSRKASLNDVSPLVAASLACWSLVTAGPVRGGAFLGSAQPVR